MNGLIILSLSALVVGVTMGLLGSGGSILTVPILVYLVGLDEKIAIASSLAIVGAIAALTSLLIGEQQSGSVCLALQALMAEPQCQNLPAVHSSYWCLQG